MNITNALQLHALRVSKLLLVILGLSGCASFERLNQNYLFTKTEAAIADKAYLEASEYLARIPLVPENTEQISKLRGELDNGIASYKVQCRDKTDALKAVGEWYEAVANLDSCIANLPEAENLKKYRKIVDTSRQDLLAEVELQLHMQEAAHLSKNAPLLSRLESLSPPRWSKWWGQYRYKKRRATITEKMLACFDEQVDGDLALAEQCLRAAKKLSPDADADGVASNLLKAKQNEQQAERRKQQEQQKAKETERKLAAFKKQYLDYINNDQLSPAVEVMRKMKKLAPDDKEVNLWGDDLQVMVLIKVTHDLDRGKALYSKGFIHQALFLWRPLAVLSPDNEEIKDYIQRAERFLQKLNRLESNG